MFDKLLAILAIVPEPHVQEITALIRGIVDIVHTGQDPDGTILTPDKLDAIFAAAMEPWARIQAKASAEITRANLGVTGSTGE